MFNDDTRTQKVGETLGFLIGYFVFTTILFFALTFLKKIPTSWTYFHIIGLTIVVTLVGTTIRRLLK